MRVVVAGAGLAGLVAALELASRGCRVTVVESSPYAGGRTSSRRAPSGLHSDTGLHVVADHYVNLLDVLASVGAADRLVWWDEHVYLRRGAAPLQLRLSRLPAPFHLLHPARAMPVARADCVRLARAVLDVARYAQGEIRRFDDVTYLDWHRSRGLAGGFLLELAEFAADATTFLHVDRVSAATLLSWFAYMFRDRHAARIGTWRQPLADALVAPLTAALGAAGACVRTSTAVVALRADEHGVRSVVVRPAASVGPNHSTDGGVETMGDAEEIPCDVVVSALPPQALRRVLDPTTAARAGLASALEVETVPAMSVVVRLGEPVPAPRALVSLVAGLTIRNVADLASIWDADGRGRLLQCLVGRAAQRTSLGDAEIIADVVDDLRAAWPALRSAAVEDARVDRIPGAMVAAVPGGHARRPPAVTGVPNLVLAGDWTRHELNSCMEGAVVSGRLAARAVLGDRATSPVRVLTHAEPLASAAWRALAGPREPPATPP
jgi:uncharacterized protein with NAD-binding domain and iron-sulfur cluster